VSNTLTQKVGGKFSSRGIAALLGVALVALAAILLLVYLRSYKSSVDGDATPTQVLVSKSLIPRGTSGTIIAQQTSYATNTFPRRDVKIGAISDPAYLNGRVAVTDILPGQQITTADFSLETTNLVSTKITGAQRGVSLPADALRMHNGTQIAAGDKLDLYIAVNGEYRLFVPAVKILATPVSGAAGGAYIVQVNTKDVPLMMVAADNTTLWGAIRPNAQAAPTAKRKATLQDLLNRTR
jgi:hypothetical protein